MHKNFVEELRWRGMLQDITPDTEAVMESECCTGYIGFDPTADSLHIGSLVQIILLMHFQRHGHKPLALIGGATGMIGDPSGKSEERNLLDEKTLRKNADGIKKQLSRFLNFDTCEGNAAELVNNYDWLKPMTLIDFARDIGKHLTVNYMMAKDSVKKRLNPDAKEGMSFTEFTYQLFQGYDFLHLYKTRNCKIQMGGSDQWGNITTGTELIRRKENGKAYALTCPLITKSDGTKFGKSQEGNIWLDADKTSPYTFYQYWLNVSDEDAYRYIRIFTFLEKSEIDALISQHKVHPHLRLLQKRLAKEVTLMVHSQEAFDNAVKASEILFGKSTSKDLKSLDEATFLAVFEGVPQATIPRSELENGLDILSALSLKTGFLKSNNEARRALKEKSIAVNKEKVQETRKLVLNDLVNDAYILLQHGKKKYFVLKAV